MKTNQNQTDKGISCPSCGRFVGAHDRCPYCGTGLQKRVSLKSMRYISIVVALAGLVCLQLMAMSRETPVKEISSITPAMNFAYITIKGVATRPMKYYRDGDKVSSCYIYLKDKTGDMRVTAYRQVAEKLYNKDVYILEGDQVEVSGKIRVAEGDKISMMLEVPDHLKVQHKKGFSEKIEVGHREKIKENSEDQLVKLSNISLENVGDEVLVEAVVEKFSKPGEGSKAPYRIIIEQNGTKLSLVFWDQTFSGIANPEKIVPGIKIQAKATVGKYRDDLQLRLKNSDDLVVLKGEETKKSTRKTETKKKVVMLTAQEASEQSDGSKVKIYGKVVDVYIGGENSRAPNKIYLNTDSGKIPVIYWPTRVHLSQNQIPSIGSEIEAIVTVNSFKGDKQFRLSRASDYKLTKSVSAPQKSEKNKFMPLDMIWREEVNSTVNVKGKVIEIFESWKESAPYKITIGDDSSNTVTIVVWPNVWNSIPETKRPKTGNKISLSGKVKEHRQTKQIQLRSAEDIQ